MICISFWLFQSRKLGTLPHFFLNHCCNHCYCEIPGHKHLPWNQMNRCDVVSCRNNTVWILITAILLIISSLSCSGDLRLQSFSCHKNNDNNSNNNAVIMFIQKIIPKWPMCRVKNLPENSQNNDAKQKTPECYSTRLTQYSCFFSHPVIKIFPEDFHQNLYCITQAINQQSTEFKMVDVKPDLTKWQWCAWKKCNSGHIQDNGRCAMKITMCSINEQNLGRDKFDTHEVKGSIFHKCYIKYTKKLAQFKVNPNWPWGPCQLAQMTFHNNKKNEYSTPKYAWTFT